MDTRNDVPLLPMMANHQKQMMRDHLVSVQGVVDGLARGDFAAIELAARKSGYSEQMGMTCSHMGTGAPGFTEQAITFHKSADTIADAAKNQDREGVVRALAATLGTCVGCHATYKQHVVDDGTWAQVTGGAPAGK
jgi:mono/diheme cytochrome c family protein